MEITQQADMTMPRPAPPVDEPPASIPERFRPSKSILVVDRFMTQFIKVGGASIITAVFLIFVFILWQIIPLFRGATVKHVKTISIPSGDYVTIGVDEWTAIPFLIRNDGSLWFVDAVSGATHQGSIEFAEAKAFTAFDYQHETQTIAYGTSDGNASIVKIHYDAGFENNKRKVTPSASAGPFYPVGVPGFPVRKIALGDSESEKLIGIIQDVNGLRQIHFLPFSQTTSLMGDSGEIIPGVPLDATPYVKGDPEEIIINSLTTDILISTAAGEVYYFNRSGDLFELRQILQPFKELEDRRVASMNFILGGVSVSVTAHDGTHKVLSLFQQGQNYRTFGQTKTFEKLTGGAKFFDYSLRNKATLMGEGSNASLRYNTTAEIRWSERLPFRVKAAAIGGKYESIVFLDEQSKVHIYDLHDPHPESSFKALFGKIWYEGSAQPAYSWQSTGASDDFEPKLSLVPLIIGTMKGTFYAMIFAVPIALLAAIYTSQFLHSRFRLIVKPTMEIMASLPSVVLGFLAALWLAPMVETRIPSILMMLILFPLSALLIGWIWSSLPIRIRVKIRPGYEWLAFFPVLLIVGFFCWSMGGIVEKYFFVVTDPDTSQKVADFRLWWPAVTGLAYEQRNSLIVGFMMGFAVIPIVFTITEDALSNVPPALTSASLALGASRWQTALRIALPTASAGIFSAIMIGLGRAVGETMIVVMATGNTPIMDFNVFSGMRTLSANIAVELPEAPAQGTLYRTLFLGAMVLFLLTFTVNTFAEILRQHLREKYKTV